MRSETTQTDLIRRLRSAEGHLRGIIGMLQANADVLEIIQQVQAVQGALREVNQRLMQHYLNDCVRAELWNPDPAVRERAIANVIAFYRFPGAGAPPK